MTTFAKRLAGERPDEVAISDEVTALGWADLDDVLNRVRLSALVAIKLIKRVKRRTTDRNRMSLYLIFD